MELLEFGYPRSVLKSQVVWFASWVVATGIGAFLSPDKSGHGTHQQLGLPPCPSVLLFDRPCPGCGLTTSWTAFIHGNFAEAFHAHPLGPPLYLVYTFTALMAMYGFTRGARFNTEAKWFYRFSVASVMIFLAFGFTRMILTPHYGTASEHSISNIGARR